MKVWTKEEALGTLTELIEEVNRLRSSKQFSTEHTLWMTKCHAVLGEVFGNTSMFYRSFAALNWRPVSGTPIDVWEHGGNFQTAVDAAYHPAFLRDLDIAKGLLLGAIDFLKDREIKEVYSVKESGMDAGLVLKVLHLAEQKLRKIIRDKSENERQIQDAFESLLVGADIPYGREVDSIEYSSKTYTPDFSLMKINLAVEVKLCSRDGREKELPAEINDDILAYQTRYQNLLFVVYDLGYIRDIDRFCKSFEEHENVTVRVVKH